MTEKPQTKTKKPAVIRVSAAAVAAWEAAPWGA